jgi:hypothetical protein
MRFKEHKKLNSIEAINEQNDKFLHSVKYISSILTVILNDILLMDENNLRDRGVMDNLISKHNSQNIKWEIAIKQIY